MRYVPIVFLFLCCAVSSSGAAAVTFSNTAPITINDNAAATPFPSSISVSGVPGVAKVTVTFTGLSHTAPSDIQMLLQAPNGTNSLIFSHVGDFTDVSGISVTLDDAAATALPNGTALTAGTYRPAHYGAAPTFPTPAPAGPYTNTTLAVFNGMNPNGTWKLFLVDNSSGDSGNISGGWSISITPPAPPVNDAFSAATVIASLPATMSGQTTFGATIEAGEPMHGSFTPEYSVWYKWVATATAQTVVEIAPGTNTFDTVLTVYAGSSLGALTEIAFNDDAPSHPGNGSGAIFTATSGTTYYIRVNGYNPSEVGDFDLLVHTPTTPVITSPSILALHHQQVLNPMEPNVQISGDNFPVSYGATGLPPGLTLDPATGIITGTATTVGVYPVTLSGTNSAGTGSTSITITVDDKPLMTSASNVSGVIGLPLTFTITALNGPITSFSASSLPAGLAINTTSGVISGTPTALSLFLPSTITLTNAAGTSSYVVYWAINPITAPVVGGSPSASAYVGVPFTYLITATNTPTSYDASGLPPGLTYIGTTGLISGTPTLAGSFPVYVFATNATGRGVMLLTVTVTQPPAPHSSSSSKKGCGHGILGAVLLLGLAAFARSRRI